LGASTWRKHLAQAGAPYWRFRASRGPLLVVTSRRSRNRDRHRILHALAVRRLDHPQDTSGRGSDLRWREVEHEDAVPAEDMAAAEGRDEVLAVQVVLDRVDLDRDAGLNEVGVGRGKPRSVKRYEDRIPLHRRQPATRADEASKLGLR